MRASAKQEKMAGWAMLAIGLTMVGFTSVVLLKRIDLQRNKVLYDGVVIGYKAWRKSLYPIVEFWDGKDSLRRFTSKGSQRPPAYDIGDTVAVIVHARTGAAEIDTFSNVWLGPILLPILGLGFAIVGFKLARGKGKTTVEG